MGRCGRVSCIETISRVGGRSRRPWRWLLLILCLSPLVRVVSLPTTGRVRWAGRDANRRYIYMQDLREIDEMVPATLPSLPQSITEVASPLRWEAWAQESSSHPDQEYATFVVGGIRNGFRIGYDYGAHSYKSCSGRLGSIQSRY